MTTRLAYAVRSWLTHRTRPAGDCLVWEGSIDIRGYARIHHDGKGHRVHRLIYMLINNLETLPDDFKLTRTCGRWGCVKAQHFKLFNPSQPADHCGYGHPFTPANTYIFYKSGGRRSRICLACTRARRKGTDRRLEPVWEEKRPHGTKGYCARGHNLQLPLPNENIYVLPNGERRCRICRRRRERETYGAEAETPTVH